MCGLLFIIALDGLDRQMDANYLIERRQSQRIKDNQRDEPIATIPTDSNKCNALDSSSNDLKHTQQQSQDNIVTHNWSEKQKDSKWNKKCKEQSVFDAIQSSFIEMVHPALSIKCFDPVRKQGIITTQRINFGDILAIELPFFKIHDEKIYGEYQSILLQAHYIRSSVEFAMRQNPDIKELWDNLDTNQAELERTREEIRVLLGDADKIMKSSKVQRAIKHYAKFITNHLGQVTRPQRKPWALYSILSKINFGLPQNVAAMFADKEDGYRCVLIATRDIEEGEELVMDYFLDWDDKTALDRTFLRTIKGRGFGFEMNDEVIDAMRHLHSGEVPLEIIAKTFTAIYSNGIKGRAPGDSGLGTVTLHPNHLQIDAATYQRKLAIVTSVHDGKIFRALKGEIELPEWMKNQTVLVNALND